MKLITYLSPVLRRVDGDVKTPVFTMMPCWVKLVFYTPSIYICADNPVTDYIFYVITINLVYLISIIT